MYAEQAKLNMHPVLWLAKSNMSNTVVNLYIE